MSIGAPPREEVGGVEVVTFGCRLNAWESEVIRRRASEAGLTDAVIVNACAVTAEAVRDARRALRRARRQRPDAEVIVTGCAAQVEAKAFAELPEVDRVIGQGEKLQVESYRPRVDTGTDGPEVRVGDVMTLRETASHLIDGLSGRTRAFVKVQDGCDHRCTFCIIPYGRGNSRSVPVDEVLASCRRLVETGHAELVLTGVDLTAYGADLDGSPTLGHLVERILSDVPELPRLRLSSVDAVELDDTLVRLFGEEDRLMPHLHLSLQAGDDMVLARMKRRHRRDDAIALCRDLRERRPDLRFGADFIAGFPTETEEMFQRTLDLVDECGLSHLHVFPYSPRPGTPATRMPQVARPVIKERARRLRERGEQALRRHLDAQVGRLLSVLVESEKGGRAADYTEVALTEPAEVGRIVVARVTGHDGARLQATSTEGAS
ncbi:MAG: tRNA (N(6)-L-threonylcarbamoyladenosine(37)-C(2))-methylthiotransferase MtaB [Acidobacteriota bacterium]